MESMPVTNASVVCFDYWTRAGAHLKDDTVEGGSQRYQTDAAGSLTLEWNGTNAGLMLAGKEGFGLAQTRDLANHPVLVVKPWGRIEGVRTDHGRPLAHHRLSLGIIGRCVDLPIESAMDMENKTTTDNDGRFIFEHVPATEVWVQDVQAWLGANADRKPTDVRLAEVDVQPGETKHVEIATHGRAVVGRIELGPGVEALADLKTLDKTLARGLRPRDFNPGNRPWVPAEFDTPDKRAKWYLDWFASTEEGRRRKALLCDLRPVMIHADGSFIAEMVEPGTYVLSGNMRQNGRELLLDALNFEVPPATNGAADSAVNAGETTLRAVVYLKPGDTAPELAAPSLDGTTLKLSGYKGKFVLLDFWATWCGPCVAETPNLRATYEAFGKDRRFVMISLSSDSEPDAPRKFAQAKGIGWAQAFLGSDWFKSPVAQNYGISAIPQIMLIGPDGRIISRDLRGTRIKEAVARALGP